MASTVVDDHDASKRVTDREVSGSCCGAWGYDQLVTSRVASERGRAHQLANCSRVGASSSMGAPPGRDPARAGYDNGALPRSSSPAGVRGYETGMLISRRCSIDSPGAVNV